MAWDFEHLRTKYPTLSDAALCQVVELLNRPRASVRHVWAGEDQRSDTPQEVGPDGLTKPQREMNAFAYEHSLPLPFPCRAS